MIDVIASLGRIAIDALRSIVLIAALFLVALVTGGLVVLRVALPYLLRVGVVMLWLAGVAFALVNVGALFGTFGGPAFLIAAVAVIPLGFSPYLAARVAPAHIWGTFFTCGISGLALGTLAQAAASPAGRTIAAFIPPALVISFTLALVSKRQTRVVRHPGLSCPSSETTD